MRRFGEYPGILLPAWKGDDNIRDLAFLIYAMELIEEIQRDIIFEARWLFVGNT